MSPPRSKSLPQNVGGPVVVWKDVFTPKELDAIEALGDGLMPMRATIAGRKEDTDTLRITRVAWMERNPETAWLYARLEEMVLSLNREFYSFDLFGLVEAFQYTVYDDQEGGHYGWHVDLGGNDVEPRKISLSLQLSDSSRYTGCDLELEAGNGRYIAERARGTLIAFPSYVLHRVTPIESGIRKSLVIWVSGPVFR
ncbi:MAG: 2OG-Fe(II) oxygenase [Rhizomicrobium sp.]